jgi:hypothetical protein
MGHPHDISRRLERQAARIESRAEAPLPAGRGRSLALAAKHLMRQRESNVIELEPRREPAPVVPREPSPLMLHGFELANGEAALVANVNEGLMDVICYARSVLRDPTAPRAERRWASAEIRKAKAEISKAQLKAARELATQLDHAAMSAHERSQFALRRAADLLSLNGYDITEPSGRKIIPREPMDASGDDDYAPEPPAPLNAKELEAEAQAVRAWTRTTNQARKRRENADRHHAAVKSPRRSSGKPC